MLTFFREGGMPMYLTLIIAIATVIIAATRRRSEQSWVLLGGAVFALASGLAGMATGLQMVAAHYRDFPEPLLALATGLRELSYNGVFGALVATGLGAAAMVVRRNPDVGPVGA